MLLQMQSGPQCMAIDVACVKYGLEWQIWRRTAARYSSLFWWCLQFSDSEIAADTEKIQFLYIVISVAVVSKQLTRRC